MNTIEVVIALGLLGLGAVAGRLWARRTAGRDPRGYAERDDLEHGQRILRRDDEQLSRRIKALRDQQAEVAEPLRRVLSEYRELRDELDALRNDTEVLQTKAGTHQDAVERLTDGLAETSRNITDVVLEAGHLLQLGGAGVPGGETGAASGEQARRSARAVRASLAAIRSWRGEHPDCRGDWTELISRLQSLRGNLTRYWDAMP